MKCIDFNAAKATKVYADDLVTVNILSTASRHGGKIYQSPRRVVKKEIVVHHLGHEIRITGENRRLLIEQSANNGH